MALTYSWNSIAASQTDSDSPIDQSLMDGLRENDYHLRQVLYGNGSGGFYTPVDGHDHDGSNSKAFTIVAESLTQPMLSYSGGTAYNLAQANTERYTANTSYTKLKEIRVARGGQINAYFELKTSNAGDIVYGRVYVNGVAAGAEYNSTSETYAPHNDNISVDVGDLVQLYAKRVVTATQAYVRNFRIRALYPETIGVVTD
jgi:hypothetical protein